jgi:hypothetical protein
LHLNDSFSSAWLAYWLVSFGCLPHQYGLLDVLRAASRPRRVHAGSERMDMNGGEMFFETASTLITFVLLGR